MFPEAETRMLLSAAFFVSRIPKKNLACSQDRKPLTELPEIPETLQEQSKANLCRLGAFNKKAEDLLEAVL